MEVGATLPMFEAGYMGNVSNHLYGFGNANYSVPYGYNGFNLISSYTYSKSMDDTSGIRTQSSELFPQDDRCISCEYGPWTSMFAIAWWPRSFTTCPSGRAGCGLRRRRSWMR
jgi:hypothetical protein